MLSRDPSVSRENFITAAIRLHDPIIQFDDAFAEFPETAVGLDECADLRTRRYQLDSGTTT